jgi:hypothetical protein
VTPAPPRLPGEHSGQGAAADRQAEPTFAAPEVEVRVAPGVKVAGAAQGLPLLSAAAVLAEMMAVLAEMMDEDDGERALPLERAKLAEQDAHLAGRVLVDPVKPDERIKHEEARPMLVERPPQPSKVALGVETGGSARR